MRLDHPGICAMEMVLAEEISYSGYVLEVKGKKFVPDDEKSVYENVCVLIPFGKNCRRKIDILSLFISLIKRGEMFKELYIFYLNKFLTLL